MTPRDNYNKHKKKTDTESYPKVIPPTSRWAPPRVTRPPTLHSTTMTPPTEKQAKMMNELTAPHRWAAGARARWGGVEWSTVAMLPACPPTVAPRRETDCERERGRISGGSCCIVKPQAPQPHLANSIGSFGSPSLSLHLAYPLPSPLLHRQTATNSGTRKLTALHHQPTQDQQEPEREMNADFGAPKDLAGGLQQRRSLYQPTLPPCLQVTPFMPLLFCVPVSWFLGLDLVLVTPYVLDCKRFW